MPYQHKNNRGTLWPNEYKQEGDKRPDRLGQMNVNGVVWDVAGWKKNINGKDVLCLVASDPADRPQRQPSQQNNSRVQGQLDSESTFDRTRREQNEQFEQARQESAVPPEGEDIPF